MPIPPYHNLTQELRCGRKNGDLEAGLNSEHITVLTPPRSHPGSTWSCWTGGTGVTGWSQSPCTQGSSTCPDWARDAEPKPCAPSALPHMWRCHTGHSGGGCTRVPGSQLLPLLPCASHTESPVQRVSCGLRERKTTALQLTWEGQGAPRSSLPLGPSVLLRARRAAQAALPL